jgi:hypothetical protein
MLSGEITVIYCNNHIELMNTLFEQSAELFNITKCGKYSNHCDLNVNIFHVFGSFNEITEIKFNKCKKFERFTPKSVNWIYIFFLK